MAYEQKPGDVAIFREKNPKSDKAPTWRGTLITPSGEKLSVALWDKGQSGTMLAGKVEIPRDNTQRGGGGDNNPRRGFERIEAERRFDDIDDEIPF